VCDYLIKNTDIISFSTWWHIQPY